MDYIVKCSNAVEFTTFLFQHGFNYVGDYVFMLTNLKKDSIIVANIQDKEFNFENSKEEAKKLIDQEFKEIDENQFKLNLLMAKTTTSKFHTKFHEDSCKNMEELVGEESCTKDCTTNDSNSWKNYAKPGYFILLKNKQDKKIHKGVVVSHNQIYEMNSDLGGYWNINTVEKFYDVLKIWEAPNLKDRDHCLDNKDVWHSKTIFTKADIANKLGINLFDLEII